MRYRSKEVIRQQKKSGLETGEAFWHANGRRQDSFRQATSRLCAIDVIADDREVEEIHGHA